MPVSIAGLVGSKGTVGEAVVATVHLPVEARLQTGSAWSRLCAVVLLHGE